MSVVPAQPSGVVIVGAGHAGVQLAESLRHRGFGNPITLIGEEADEPYERPPLTKQFLNGSTELTPLRGNDFYRNRSIDLRLGRRVVNIVRSQNKVVLDDGEFIEYQNLVLATGARSRPFQGTIDASAASVVHTIRTAADAQTFTSQLDSARSLVIVGAGFIGLEVAAAARKRGISVSIVAAGRPLSRIASPTLSDFLLAAHRGQDSRFRFDRVSSIMAVVGSQTQVSLLSGDRLYGDLVLIAIGSIPNVELAASAGLAVSNGVEVDEYGMTSDENIWAIGDVASRSNGSGGRTREESIQAAGEQARCLAATLTGIPTICTEVPWFWSNQGALRLQIAGIASSQSSTVVRGDIEQGRFSVFAFDGDALRAVESVNSPKDHISSRRILARGVDLLPQQAADLSFDLKAHSHSTATGQPMSGRLDT
ncbi:pyridine nucleotide-disulfide oxidoreductase (plasmid) [Rhodococcus erythropolis R138]|uniref:NAD(P)/FAD-dependent oxidoreductase n=1 Tax=Rhodococcus erythropolis TaxID=1833 RepID=UPI0005605A19|nr:FAD-dependent oxidoreductase [Rhodococcus erythropolis]ALU73453.1 pyridine nucleotide-disulfide oxidoreductase [Rhodococcus erythropolis R138]